MLAPSASTSASYSIESSALVWIVCVTGSIQPSSPLSSVAPASWTIGAEWIAVCGAVGERLADDHRPVDELGVGRDDGHIGVVARKIGQGQRRLQGGYPSADDDHAKLVWMRALVAIGAGIAGHRYLPALPFALPFLLPVGLA